MNVLSDANRTARKRHGCDVCHEWIEPGTVYNDFRGVDYGRAYTYRSHLACKALGCAFVREFCRDEFNDSDVWEFLDNATLADVMALREVQALTDTEQERVKAQWQKVHVDVEVA